MKIKGSLYTFIAVVLLLCKTGCGSSGSGKIDVVSNSNMELIPVSSEYAGAKCRLAPDSQDLFNNNGQIIFEQCGQPDYEYLLWDNGELMPLRFPDPETGYFLKAIADDGTIIGNKSEDEQLISFVLHQDGQRVDTPNADYAAISQNGKFIVDSGSQATDGQPRLFRTADLSPVSLATVPEGFSLTPEAVSDDGTVTGVAATGDDEHAFSASYGFRWSKDNFELIPAPGRPEASRVLGTVANSQGDMVLNAESGSNNDKPLIIFHDGRQLTIPVGLAEENVDVWQINVRVVVVGFYGAEGRQFFFSEKSGVKTLRDLLPDEEKERADSYTVIKINDRNQVLLSYWADEGRTEEFYLFQLSEDF